MKKSCLLFFLISTFRFAVAQNNLALPEIINYSKLTYGAGTQNWGIAQDRDGIMYFANNEGLLTYDGTYWKVYPLPNQTIVRSVAVATDGKIFVGGQDELGFFAADARGRLKFQSLLPLIAQSDRSFTDVWSIVFYKSSVFFRTSAKIFQYSANQIITFPSTEWRFLGCANGILLAQDQVKGLLQFRDNFWIPLTQPGSLSVNSLVTSFSPLDKNSCLITTLKSGCFILKEENISAWTTQDIASVAEKKLTTASNIGDENLLLATGTGGCYVVNKHGLLVSSFTRKDGIQNNNVLSVFCDRDKNLWLGTDNGIDFIAYNNAIKHILPDADKEASGYSSLIYSNDLYLGTSNGLYKAKLSAAKDLSYVRCNFQPVANSGGQVWNISEVNGKLLLGHHEGAFTIENDKAIQLDASSGFWTFLPFYSVLPSSLMVAGTYQGISFYNYDQKTFQRLGDVPFESARFVFVDGKSLWVSHPYKGIFKVSRLENNKPVVVQYGKNKGVQSINNNYLFKIRNRVVLASEKGIFDYNPVADKFEPSELYNGIFGDIRIRYMKEDKEGNIWFVFKKNLGVVDMSEAKPAITYISELDNKLLSGFEHVYPVDENNIFVGGEQGFYHINYKAYKRNTTKIEVGIRNVSAFNKKDSLLFGGYRVTNYSKPKVCYDWNTLHFEYSSTLFGHQQNIEYSYQLDGFDKTWSAWTKKTTKEYTNLPAGSYTLRVKARTNLGNESAEAIYSFTVLPPWHQTPWAYAAYFLLMAAAIYRVHIYQKNKMEQQRRRHAEEQERLKYLHDLELDKSEKQIVQLKNEKLEAEINHKNKDLATVAMHLVEKGEFIGKIKDELIKIKGHPESEKLQDNFKKIIKVLSDEEKKDEDWEHFSLHFDKVHSDFLLALKQRYPNLSANDLKMSGFLRMNLSSKEIAQLMNISVRGVEISRYRLRKKLAIPTEVNLFHFFMEFTGSAQSSEKQVDSSKTEPAQIIEC